MEGKAAGRTGEPKRPLEPMRIPELDDRVQERSVTVDHILYSERHMKDYAQLYADDGGEWLFGFRIPPFQRPAVWTRNQQVRFIQSLWLHLPIGQYVVNMGLPSGKDGKLPRQEHWLIDGQQRLRAIKAYVEDEFPVFDLRHSELNVRERRRLMNTIFPMGVICTDDEKRLRALYDRLAYGGTPHDPSQRALPEGADEELPTGMRP